MAQHPVDTPIDDGRPSFLGQSGPASIRMNNPGAQYPGPSARKFASIGTKIIGGGHKIAVFDDAIDGGAALFDLYDRVYVGLKLRDAIRKWAGGNHIQSYLDVFWDKARIQADTIITREMLRDPDFGVRFAKAMAWHEAGKEYPLSDEDWHRAHRQAFFNTPSQSPPNRIETKQALAKSQKRSVTGVVKKTLTGGGFFAAIMARWAELKAWLGVGNEMMDQASALASSVGWLVLFAICIVLAIVFNWLEIKQVDDFQEGRYIPSGAET